MKVLSLFDGMSCGQIALKELGYPVEKYYSAEIDKYAMQQTQHNFPNTIQLGDVTQVKAKDLDKIDLLIGGSPCQGFSFAGKQLNFDDPRSALFFEFVRLWEEIRAINPDAKFLLENVNMKRKHMGVISKYMGVFPVNINSNLVSAQNRNRWYWSNIKTREDGFFNEVWTDFPQPEDKGILLKDILQPESEIDEKYYLSDKVIANFVLEKSESHIGTTAPPFRTIGQADIVYGEHNKAGTIMCPGNGAGNHSDMDIICVAMRGREDGQELEPRADNKTNTITSVAKDNLICYNVTQKVTVRKHEVDIKGLQKCLKSHKKTTISNIAEAMGVPQTEAEHWFRTDNCFSIPRAEIWHRLKGLLAIETDEFDESITEFEEKDNVFEQANRAYDVNGKNPTLLSGAKGNLIMQRPHGTNKGGLRAKDGKTPSLTANASWEHNNLLVSEATNKGYVEIQPGECVDLENPKSKTRRGRKMDSKSNSLMTGQTQFHKLTEDFKLRRLTPLECSRLQTIPEWYEWIVSDTQIYRMLGNGWTVKVIEHIFSNL